MVVKMSTPRPHNLDCKPGQFILHTEDVGEIYFLCPDEDCHWFGYSPENTKVSLAWLNRVAEGHLEEMIQVDPRYRGDAL